MHTHICMYGGVAIFVCACVIEKFFSFPDILLFIALLAESNQRKTEMQGSGTSFPKSFICLFVCLFLPDNRMMKTTNTAAFEILLFDIKIDSVLSCTRLLALSAQLKAIPLSLIQNLWMVDPINMTIMITIISKCKQYISLLAPD